MNYRDMTMGLTVYPRWRGEHPPTRRRSLFIAGLSPLARGTLRVKFDRLVNKRFIPAGAGNTGERSGCCCCGTVYPRWRGEHITTVKLKPLGDGLSPLARGTHKKTNNRNHSNRFIPAGAGNTNRYCYIIIFRAVYPRWRGEHSFQLTSPFCLPGLSPLARGTQYLWCS